jgi:hypothetical protein
VPAESATKKTRTRSAKPVEEKLESSEAKALRENAPSSEGSSDSGSGSGERRRGRDFDDERRGGEAANGCFGAG